jgi:hypothetical protein
MISCQTKLWFNNLGCCLQVIEPYKCQSNSQVHVFIGLEQGHLGAKLCYMRQATLDVYLVVGDVFGIKPSSLHCKYFHIVVPM